MAHELPIDRMSFGERLAYAFRERQIYVRSEGQVRFITLRPWVQICFVLIVVGVFGWIAYATLTVAFKDYVIAAKKRQFADVQTVYEDRITQMLSNMDQLNGQRLLNQDAVEAQLEGVRDVQSELELRQRQIAALVSKQYGVSMSELLPAAEQGPSLSHDETGSRMLINFEPNKGDIRFSRIPGRQSSLESESDSLDNMMRVGHRLRALAAAQRAALNVLETHAVGRTTQLAKTITGLGFKPERFQPAEGEGAALGGPLIQLGAFDPDAPLSAESRQVMRISRQTDIANAYANGLSAMPVRLPLESGHNRTSGFGPRRDPFTGMNAMHQGIDWPRKTGTPVMTAASGKVKRSGWSGAYGRLIEIVHDNGLSTRYAHLSKLKVKVGQRVEAGQIIGLVGSTGRSTGPHLHYETRINGNAVDPMKFLRAGKYVLK